MENIVYRIDSFGLGYNQSLYIDGWAYIPGVSNVDLRLMADETRLIETEIVWKERPDVVECRKDEEEVPLCCGFTCYIKNPHELLDKGYSKLEIWVEGEEDTNIFSIGVTEILLEASIKLPSDEIGIIKDELCIGGWLYLGFGEVNIEVLDGNDEILPAEIKLERHECNPGISGSDDSWLEFEIYIKLRDIAAKKIILAASLDGDTKPIEIDVCSLKHKNKKLVKLAKACGVPKWKENIRYLREHGRAQFAYRLGYDLKDSWVTDYEYWASCHRISKRGLRRQKKTRFSFEPLISIVIPLYNTPVDFFCELIDCFIAQSYKNWQLALADASATDGLAKLISEKYPSEKRIKYTKLEKNGGISENTNEAIKIADGEFIMFTDHDDFIEPDALFEIVKAINSSEKPDIIYTDEDKFDTKKRKFYAPHFKSDYNPFMLLTNNYITHIFVVRREIADKAGKLNSKTDGAQDYDFILRCCELSGKVYHIPKILYHWRIHPASTAKTPASKPYAYIAGEKALQSHFDRIGVPAKVTRDKKYGYYNTKFILGKKSKVSLVFMSTGDVKRDLSSIKSAADNTEYENYDILYCADEKGIEEFKDSRPGTDSNIIFVNTSGSDSGSAAMNEAAKISDADYLLFLDRVIDITSKGWLEKMLGCFQVENVGAVGVRLEYKNRAIHHAGIVIGAGEDKVGAHLLHGYSGRDSGYMSRNSIMQNLSAVSARFMLVKREDFIELEGFDEGLDGIYRSIDFCLRLRSKGKLVVYEGSVGAKVSHEKRRSAYKGKAGSDAEKKQAELIRSRWGRVIDLGDPYYNPNMSLDRADYSLDYLRL